MKGAGTHSNLCRSHVHHIRGSPDVTYQHVINMLATQTSMHALLNILMFQTLEQVPIELFLAHCKH